MGTPSSGPDYSRLLNEVFLFYFGKPPAHWKPEYYSIGTNLESHSPLFFTLQNSVDSCRVVFAASSSSTGPQPTCHVFCCPKPSHLDIPFYPDVKFKSR